jgi:hypothetical protein
MKTFDIFFEIFCRVFRLSFPTDLPCLPSLFRIRWHPISCGGHIGDLVHLSSSHSAISSQGESTSKRIFLFSYFFLLYEGLCPLVLWHAIRLAIWPAIRCQGNALPVRNRLHYASDFHFVSGSFVPSHSVPISSPSLLITRTKYYDMISDLKWTFYSTSQIRYIMIIFSQYNLYCRKNNHNISYLTCALASLCQAVEKARVLWFLILSFET